METAIILSKDSSKQEIKSYFEAILKLSQSNEDFPVNLDEVWPLVYTEKGKAVRALQENFIQDIDYQIFAQNGKNSNVGRPSIDYYLSLSCLEYFVVRKVRPVFDVYRSVFHQAAKSPALPLGNEMFQQVKAIDDKMKRLESVLDKKNEGLAGLAKMCPDLTINVKLSELMDMVDYCIERAADKMEMLIVDSDCGAFSSRAPQKEIMTSDELCQYTGMAKQHLYNLTHKKKIPYYQPGGKVMYFNRSEIDAWLLSNRVSTDAEMNSKAQAYCMSKK